jgi:nucleoside-diphosphate-sugar epimerase
MRKKILVLGSSGYVGTKLVTELAKENHEIICFDTQWFGNFISEHKNIHLVKGDIRNIDHIQMDGIDTIIHLANISNDPCGELNAKLSWEVNVLATKFIIEKAIKHKVKQFIFASSGSVYGVKSESQVTEELDLVPISDYNKTKLISERVLLSYSDKICIQIVRPATICGYSPRMRLDLSVNMLTVQALKNKKITVFGGNQVRPNIHINDMIRVYKHFLEKGDKLEGIYNAGFENISILDIANLINEKIPSEIIVSPSTDPRSYRLNSDKLIKSGFLPEFNVKYAIEELKEKYNQKVLKDDENWYNLKVMKKLNIN